MFRHEGPARSLRKNVILATGLALVAGFVNSAGFLLLGSFTSHVTGSAGRLGTDVALGDLPAAGFASLLVLAFFAGAFGSSLIVESGRARPPLAYGAALLVEALLLGGFVLAAALNDAAHPRVHDALAAILCAAMGMQNALVTRLSGSVVRTTHLTGVVTDLGIEAVRWLRFKRGTGERPPGRQALLWASIVFSFIAGALLGGATAAKLGRWAMAMPSAAVLLASLLAFFSAGPAERT